MIIYEFTHQGRLMNLNDALGMKGTSNFKYNNEKKKQEESIMWSIKDQLRGHKIGEEAFATVFTWFHRSGRADPDNIASAVKYIFDAAQKCGFIKNDNWKQTSGGIMHRFKKSPDGVDRVRVQFLLGGQLKLGGIADEETDREIMKDWKK